jgi:hypothetical protein
MEAIIDVAQDVGAHAKQLAAAGVRTVIRYYNHRNTPANPQKCLGHREHWELSDAGLSVCVVFEQRGGAGDANHPMGHIEDFTAATGARDGARALALATQLGQPVGSGIYFAVDWDFTQAEQLSGAYRCGVYGSGMVARILLAKGLVDLVWLAGATGWSQTKAFHAEGGWHLFQHALQRKSAIGGFFYDGNIAHPAHADFGQFGGAASAERSKSPQADLYAVAARSGLKLRRGPGTGFTARRTVPFGTKVHAMGRNGAWMLVDLQGDGKADGHMHADYLRPVERAVV